MNDLLNQILEMSPAALFVLGFNGLGLALKKSPVANWMIPYILAAVGALLWPCISDPSKVSYTMKYPVVYQALVGAVLAGFSVYLNQATRQFLNRDKTDSGNTQFITKPPTP